MPRCQRHELLALTVDEWIGIDEKGRLCSAGAICDIADVPLFLAPACPGPFSWPPHRRRRPAVRRAKSRVHASQKQEKDSNHDRERIRGRARQV